MKEAKLTGDVIESIDPDCMDTHYFVLKLGETKFVMSLENVLECLRFAEKEGIVPKLPSTWWHPMTSTYRELEEPIKVDKNDTLPL